MKQGEEVPITNRPTEIEPITLMHNSLKESVTFNAYQLYLLDDQSILFTHAIHQSDSVNEAFLLSKADSDTLKELLLIEEAQ
ncbi:hypothetical protein JOC54_000300 [Alkalihalobacillus xiaoxiensis]|uniref:Uncharacterized protein n=1 Tax=Shouchella xiaoxiensis TaxID=766895 RepID=A0ABS2SRC5_9BACI|nr:hypothetical protein [Shouchella xiaoxiensis]MBM7837069.1 hypothetical protein [Shouchella xiaoxiensis]